jgi:tetratricopeptide (TPR) repeat protein
MSGHRLGLGIGLGIGLALVAASGGALAVAAGAYHPARLAALLLHVLLGAALLVPGTVWWWRQRRSAAGAAGFLLLAGGGAGLALAAAGNRQALAPLLWAHGTLSVAGLLALPAALAAARRGVPWKATAALAGGLAVVAACLLQALRREKSEAGPFVNPPASLTMAGRAMGGAAGPFYPSALATASGGLLPARFFTAASSCGRAGCHPDVAAQWSASAHRFSGLDNPWYRRSYEAMRQSQGEVAARWCAGCHTPAPLATGAPARPPAARGGTAEAEAGVGCTVCHAARARSSMGQADLELDPARLAGLPESAPTWRRALYSFAIRLDPGPHRRALGLAGTATSELCSACHKGQLDAAPGGHPPLAVMNDYDPWQASSVSGQGMTQSIHFPPPRSCTDCHMPAALLPAGGGAVRSHRFAAANTALPALRGDREQLRAVVAFLAARRVTLDIFAMTPGRPLAATAPEAGMSAPDEEVIAPLDRVPAMLRRGESSRFDVVLRSRGVGHLFPGGKDAATDCWLAVEAVDDRGRNLFSSGGLAADGTVAPGAHRLGGLWLDAKGTPIEAFEIWRNWVEAWVQRVAPEAAAIARFRVAVPADAGSRITLTARLEYRKFPPDFTRRALEGRGGAAFAAPIVTMAETSLTLPVVAAGAPLPDMAHPRLLPADDLERWNDYAFALADSGSWNDARRAFQAVLARRPGFADGWTTLGNLEWAVGDLRAARTDLLRALSGERGLARAHFYLGLVEQKEGRYAAAKEQLQLAAAAYPRDPLVWLEIGRTRFLSADYGGAAAALGRMLGINPQEPTAHFMYALTLRALGDSRLAAEQMALFQHFRYDTTRLPLRSNFLQADADAALESQGFHVHASRPPQAPQAPERVGRSSNANPRSDP